MKTNGLWKAQGPLLILIVFISCVYLLQVMVGREAYFPFMVVPAEVMDSWRNVQRGEWSLREGSEFGTLLSSVFLHGSPDHVLWNMIFLWMFAALVRELLGVRWMLLVFFVTGVSGSLCHVFLNMEDLVPMLGASGAVMGFAGAYLGLALRWHLPDPHVWPISRPIAPSRLALFAVFKVAGDYFGLMSQAQTFTAYGAHIGGFLGGLFLTGFLAPQPKVARSR